MFSLPLDVSQIILFSLKFTDLVCSLSSWNTGCLLSSSKTSRRPPTFQIIPQSHLRRQWQQWPSANICCLPDLRISCPTPGTHAWLTPVFVTQSCLTLCDPVDCSPPGSLVHGILQARILEWVAISFSRGSPQPRDRTRVPHRICRQILYLLTHQGSPWVTLGSHYSGFPTAIFALQVLTLSLEKV